MLWTVGLGNTGIWNNHAQKSPGTLALTYLNLQAASLTCRCIDHLQRNVVSFKLKGNLLFPSCNELAPDINHQWRQIARHWWRSIDQVASSHTSQELWPWNSESPKESVPRHVRIHVVWSRALKCSVKSIVIEPSTKCYFNEFLFMRGPLHTW